MVHSAAWALGKKWKWIPSLCRAIVEQAGEHFYDYSRDELAALILAHAGFSDAWQDNAPPRIKHYCLDLPIAPEKPAWLSSLALPELATIADLTQWLKLSAAELDWFADKWREQSPTARALQHYRYRWLVKKSGGLRLIEIPKQRLRSIQTHILRKLLDLVPPHSAAHGFRRAHSCVTHASLHAGKRVVVRMDLKNFFTSISYARIHAMFGKLGYSSSVAAALARLCTHRTPLGVFSEREITKTIPWQERHALRTPHLPQGSPSSPALANLCAHRLDIRLDALANSLNARYSRYADDLTFSGEYELEQAMERFSIQVAAIALEEGFSVNTRKTRLMRAGVRQQVTGLLVNRHPNTPREEFDILKATLTNCIRHDPASQNREGRENYRQYLAGRIAFVHMVNAKRGVRLKQLFEKIKW